MSDKIWAWHFRSVIWKEIVETIRATKITFFMSVIVPVFIQYIPIANIINDGKLSLEMKETLLGTMLIYLPLMVLPFFGHTLVYRSIHDERMNKTIPVLLASGFRPTAVWMGKFLVAVLFSYITSVLTIPLYAAFVKFYFGYGIRMTFEIWLMVLFVMPVFSIGALALVSCGYWFVKNGQIFGMIFPLVALIGVWNLSVPLCKKYPPPFVGIIALLTGIAAILTAIWVVRRIPKERIVNN